uniref:Reticulon-like protein n=1 Tax=Kalanchoe fedtschenkoi TaxID=63787 RepID=A0A7N0T2Z2_KALFE
MRDGKQAENILTSLAQLAEDAANKNMSIFEEAAATRSNKVLGRQKSIHHTLGGGKSADVLLWRNKKVSAGVLSSATAVWILFEWLNYNFLTLVCFVLILGMLGQFMWSNASGYLRISGSSSQAPRLVLPDELFISIAMSVGKEANKVLGYLQDISCGGNLKQLLLVIVSLLAASVIGTWCNFLTVIYIGFVAAHTLPILYERYEDEFDGFISQALV